jgi:hypothetical protein
LETVESLDPHPASANTAARIATHFTTGHGTGTRGCSADGAAIYP